MKIIESVNNYIVNPHIWEERARFSHYPSEASVISRTDKSVIGKCHRASWYSWKKYEATNPVDARGRWAQEMGKKVEEVYVEMCKRLGIWAGNNVHFYDIKRNISGEIDIFIFAEPKTIDGVEIKTGWSDRFRKEISQFPRLNDLLQCMIYMAHYPDIPIWHLIYKALDTKQEWEYILTLRKDETGTYLNVDSVPLRMFYLQDVYDRYKKLGEHILVEEPPSREYVYSYSIEQSKERVEKGIISKYRLRNVMAGKITDSDWRCLYCNQLDRCWAKKRQEMKKGVK